MEIDNKLAEKYNIAQIKQFYMLSDMVDAKRCEKIDRLNGLVCKYEGGAVDCSRSPREGVD